MNGSDIVEHDILMRDRTLVARLLLSGAAVEIPVVSATGCYRVGDGYSIELEMESVGITLLQWVAADELESAVRWMITRAVATQDRLSRN